MLLSTHFVLIKINRSTYTITVYDPIKPYFFAPIKQKKAFAVTTKLLNKFEKLVGSTFVWTEDNYCLANCPQQPHNFSCGFYVMMFLEVRFLSFLDEEALVMHVHNFRKVKLPKAYSCPGCFPPREEGRQVSHA